MHRFAQTRQPASVCVYCGSNAGNHSSYVDQAHLFGRAMTERNITLVYGGSNVGLMKIIADTVLTAGGKVIGVIPRHLVDRELAHDGLSELHMVETLHQRKTRMFELADAFVALPGGFGTMDEIFEILTWKQMNLHDYPCAFLDVRNYYHHLHAFIEHMINEGFLSHHHLDNTWFGQNPDALFDWMSRYKSTCSSDLEGLPGT